MLISTKGRYGLRVMLDLAEHRNEGFVALKDIAERQEMSKKYLEIVVKQLVTGKLVKGTSGKGGGYHLTRQPEEYTILEILKLTESSMSSVACLEDGAEACPNKDKCKTISMWSGFDKLTKDYFSKITLRDLLC